MKVASQPAGWVGACHCRMCQRWSGALFMCFPAPEADVTVDGPVRIYASSDFAERAFCATCGSHLWMRDKNTPGTNYELMPGLFDDAAGWSLRSEVYADQAMKAVDLRGDHPCATAAEYEAKHPHVEGGLS
ncbi:GFA family protein [Yoonia sp. BS5-3]|uniref:GFA family protein n=1 Tax=Yoonia phaeophyticola TaxID=3137369 RepID=A0ABZ2V7F3_9RHOB